MKKFITIFMIVTILATMFTGCGRKDVAVNDDSFVDEIVVKPITVNPIVIEETIIKENIIIEDNVVTWDDASNLWG